MGKSHPKELVCSKGETRYALLFGLSPAVLEGSISYFDSAIVRYVLPGASQVNP